MASKINQIARDTQVIRKRLVERVPSHFGPTHIVTSFFGALFFGFTFVLKGLLFQVGAVLTSAKLTLIIIATLLTLTAEIYYVGYKRIPNKKQRPFGQFWAKRIITYYGIALFTSYLLLTLYNIPTVAPVHVSKLVIAISFPAAIGAALADLLGKY